MKKVKFLFFLHLLLAVNAINENSEIVTLQKQNHVDCVTENMILPIYLSPPIADEDDKNATLLVNEIWTDDDWELKDAGQTIQGPVTDKRWEYFKTIFSEYYVFTDRMSVSFSIYQTKYIEIYIEDAKSTTDYIKKELNDSSKWTHFTVFLKDGNMTLSQDDKLTLISDKNFSTDINNTVTIRLNETTFLKIHEYAYKWANTITKEKPTILTALATSKKTCLMLYAAVCDECFLNISSSNYPNMFQIFGKPSTTMTNPWQFLKVDVEPGKENTLRFHRGRKNNKDLGEWEIDVRWCPDINNNNKVTYTTNSSKIEQKNRTCHFLEQVGGEVSNKTEENHEENSGFDCAPGLLGRSCNITCTDVLGSENQYCQAHRICVNSECKCAWGLQGSSCETNCSSGYWGPSCESKCNKTCTDCNSITGECNKSAATENKCNSTCSDCNMVTGECNKIETTVNVTYWNLELTKISVLVLLGFIGLLPLMILIIWKTKKYLEDSNLGRSSEDIPLISSTKEQNAATSLEPDSQILGTTDYECMVRALYALKLCTDKNIADFKIIAKTNYFGDINLETTFSDQTTRIFCIQLKYKDDKKLKVEKAELESANDPFSLHKNLKLIEPLHSDNTTCILYTNCPTTIKDNSSFSFSKKLQETTRRSSCKDNNNVQQNNPSNSIATANVVVKKHCSPDNVIEMLTNNVEQSLNNSNVFQFEITQTEEIFRNVNQLCKQFYFFAGQDDITTVESSVRKRLNNFSQHDVCYPFVTFIKEGHSRKFDLTKHDIFVKLFELAVSPYIIPISQAKKNNKGEYIARTVMKFEMTIVKDCEESVVAQIWSDVANNDVEYGTITQKYSIDDSESIVKHSKTLWYLNIVPLIIKITDKNIKQVKCAIKLLETDVMEDKKRILLLGNTTKNEFPNWDIFENLCDLFKNNKEDYGRVMETFNISLQGREPITLKQLMSHSNLDQMGTMIETKQLLKMSQENLIVGDQEEKLGSLHIPRSVLISLINTTLREKCQELVLNNSQLEEYKKKLLNELQKGLGKSTHSTSTVKCYVTYVQDFPDGSETGEFLVLDLGGSNFRALLVDLSRYPSQEKPKILDLPEHIKSGSGQQLFEHIADCLAKFIKEKKISNQVLPLGFIFSFPLKHISLTKGILERWTKGFNCSDVVGKDVVEMLKEAIDKRGDIKVGVCAILNDTTGTLLSCALKDHHCKIGLIIGTSINVCYVEKQKNAEMFDEPDRGSGNVLINCEWGAFGDDGALDYVRTAYDRELDKNTVDPGKQLHEKMISGMYMGELVRLVMKRFTEEGMMFGGKGSEALSTRDTFYTKYVSEIESDAPGTFTNCKEVLEKLGLKHATEQDFINVRYICECVSRRASHLVSAGIATILNKMKEPRVTVGIDGSLYRFHPHFHNLMMEKISELVDPGIEFNLMLSEEENDRGAALVAAMAARKR